MITRRLFFRIVGAAPLWGLACGRNRERAADIMINRFSVAGFQYYEGPDVIDRIRTGDELSLRVEPDNPYDEFAVEIFWGRVKLGYVPRSDNRHISRLLAEGAKLAADVQEAAGGKSDWPWIRAAVYLPLMSHG